MSRTPCGVCELKFQQASLLFGSLSRTPCGVCELKSSDGAVEAVVDESHPVWGV